MGTRVPVEHYSIGSADEYIGGGGGGTGGGGGSLHDLNSGDDVDRGAGDITEDSLDNGHDSPAVDCMHDSYRNALPLHGIDMEDDRVSLDNNGSTTGPFDILTIDDVSPIETARARFLDIIVDHFISPHVVEVLDSESEYTVHQPSPDKMMVTSKRKPGDVQYEGDAQYVLPLMYVANMYETLVNEVNARLSSLNGTREKTIGVALEAAGGLYRKLAKKFPRKGRCAFKRRELATSFETRSRFPELVIQEEKRVRFVVVNGLAIVEKPTNMHIDDAEWFKKLTGRTEVVVSPRDYKFYAPRHKYRRMSTNSIPNIPGLTAFPSPDNSSHLTATQGYRSISEPQNTQQTPPKEHLQPLSQQAQFHPLHPSHQHHIHHSQHTHFPQHQHLPDITHAQQPSTMSQHMSCLPSLGHVGGRLHVLPTTPAKFCDECGAPYLRETSKFCSECGVKRLGT